MRNLLFLFFMLATFSCQNIDKQNINAKSEALNSGVHIDTIFKGITFNDSPTEFKIKINKLISEGYCSGYNRFEYSFKYPTELRKYNWTIDGRRTGFYNDSLCFFTLKLELDDFEWKHNNWFAPLDTLFTYKYGEPVRDYENSTFNWYVGNLEVQIYGVSYDSPLVTDYVLISYRNSLKMLEYNTADKTFEDNSSYGFNLCYSMDYWNKTYAKADSILVDEVSNDI